MALAIAFCRFGEINVSDDLLLLFNEFSYKLYDNEASDQTSAQTRNYKGDCAISLFDLLSLNLKFECDPIIILDFIKILLPEKESRIQDSAKEEINYLWNNVISHYLTEFAQSLKYHQMVSFYAYCYSTNNLEFVKWVLNRLKTDFGWCSLNWDATLINCLRILSTPLRSDLIEEFLHVLKDIGADNIAPGFIEKFLAEVILQWHDKAYSDLERVLDFFATECTESQILGGAKELMNLFSNSGFFQNFYVLHLDLESIFAYLLKKCQIQFLINNRMLLFLSRFKSPFGKKSNEEILKLYLDITGEDIHILGDAPLRETLLRGDLEASKYLIYLGADMRKPLQRISKRVKKVQNPAIDFANGLLKLHNQLRSQKNMSETLYRNYYETKICVKVANKLNATFNQIAAVYNQQLSKNQKKRKPKPIRL